MRRKRLKIEDGCYHVVSRISGQRFLMDDAEKKVLLGMIRAAAEFSGVEIYTYAMMTNHFHLLVRVPRKIEVDDAELERRMRALYGEARADKVLEKWETWMKKGAEEKVEDEKARLRARMYDISQFCKTFKETYTQDYNRRSGNTGTIWEGRFKSNLVEPSSRALAAVAAYIHLNPVRAKMSETAEAAAHTGFGAACNGGHAARHGLKSLASAVTDRHDVKWREVKEAFHALHERKIAIAPNAKSVKLPGVPVELLDRRVPGFLHGAAIGGPAFLKRVAAILPPRLHRRAQNAFDGHPEAGIASVAGVKDDAGRKAV